MTTTAKFMAKSGVVMPLMINAEGLSHGTRPFNKGDAHEMFTSYWLGIDENGARLSWSKTGRKNDDGELMRAADRGERFNALRKHELWAIDKGLTLFKPREGEYHKLEQEQNK